MEHITNHGRYSERTRLIPETPSFIYTLACHESEAEICRLELRELLGAAPPAGADWVSGKRRVDPDRSPFLTGRLDIMFEARTPEQIAELASGLDLGETTFKVISLKAGDYSTYEEKRRLERLVGSRIQGQADMKNPGAAFGLMSAQGTWYFGRFLEPERAWYAHKHKPQNYSTGLSSRLARALVNIAAPGPEEEKLKLLDPCCGMGNVMIEALSMGIDIEGCDINPLAVRGARVNLKHYGYSEQAVKRMDMKEWSGHYDAAVLDMPYNLCSVLPLEDKREMLESLRRLADRAVIISTEPLDDLLRETGWLVIGKASAAKGTFIRKIWLCKHQ